MAYTPEQLKAIEAFANSSDEQRNAFQNQFGGDLEAYGRSIEQWWKDNWNGYDINQYPEDMKLLDALDYNIPASTTGQTTSQGADQFTLSKLYENVIVPALTSGVTEDQAAAREILNRYAPQLQNSGAMLSQFQASPDWNQYLRDNPDIVQFYEQNREALAAQGITTPEQFAVYHWTNYGRNESGRTQPQFVSPIYRQQVDASQQAFNSQIDAIKENVGALTQNLDGELKARGAALQAQIDAYNAGLSTFGEAERRSIANQIATEMAALEQEIATKKASLQTALGQMGEALTAEDAARKAALTEAVSKLEAAQAPVNAARVQAAKSMQTAVNLGAEQTRDQIAAQQAAKGFVGGGSASDMALARATIGARQQSAQAMSDAVLQNASDTAGIARFGATEGYGISTDTAKGRTGLANYGATEGRGITDYGATQQRGITSAGATANRGLDNTLNQGTLDITKFGADQTRSIADYGAGAQRTINDNTANAVYTARDSAAQRRYALFNDDINRQLSLITAPAQMANAELSLRQNANNMVTSNLNNNLGVLNPYRVNQNPAPSAQTYMTQPNTATGDALVGAGGGLFSTAGRGLVNYFGSNTPAPSASPQKAIGINGGFFNPETGQWDPN